MNEVTEQLLNQALQYFFHIALVAICGAGAVMWQRLISVMSGTQALLLDRLIQEHDYYMELGYMPLHKKTLYKKKHDAYLGLGKNGIMDKYYDEVLNLPTNEVKDK